MLRVYGYCFVAVDDEFRVGLRVVCGLVIGLGWFGLFFCYLI